MATWWVVQLDRFMLLDHGEGYIYLCQRSKLMAKPSCELTQAIPSLIGTVPFISSTSNSMTLLFSEIVSHPSKLLSINHHTDIQVSKSR